MSKQITVIPATGGAYNDLQIEPGTTPRDVKAQLNLAQNYVLTRGQGAEPIPDDENLFESCTEGSKIYVTSDVEWGEAHSLLSSFWKFLNAPNFWGTTRAKLVASRPVSKTGAARRGKAVTVQRAQTPYWKERGWQAKDRSLFEGLYETPHGKWQGYITISPGNRLDVFIWNPPQILKRHPHWTCFRPRSNGWYFIHPISRVPDVSAGILSVKKLLTRRMKIKITQCLISLLIKHARRLKRRKAERDARRQARAIARMKQDEKPLTHIKELFPQTFIIESFFAREVIKVLTRGVNEEMHFLTGPKLGPIRIISRWAEPVQLERQSPVFVRASARSVASILIPIIEQGAELHIIAHSHPGTGGGASFPSSTDIACLGHLQKNGSSTIGCIVTRDGYVRFFTVSTIFRVMVLGTCVKEISENVFHITH